MEGPGRSFDRSCEIFREQIFSSSQKLDIAEIKKGTVSRSPGAMVSLQKYFLQSSNNWGVRFSSCNF